VQARPPIAVTNAVSWRSEGIRYRKNEVFLDVIESLNLLVSSNGNVLRSEILGAIKMKCYLSGMPELRLGLNDKVMFETTGRATRGKAVEMEDVKFHQCVRLSRFENDRTISFIPPDGEFELMSYRLNTQVKPLIWVECVVESHSGSRIEYMLKVRRGYEIVIAECDKLANTARLLGQSAVQATQHSQQRVDHRAGARRRGHAAVPHEHRHGALHAGDVVDRVEDQAVRRRQGVPDARGAGAAVGARRRRQGRRHDGRLRRQHGRRHRLRKGQAPHPGQVRDPLLHHQRHPGALPEDHRAQGTFLTRARGARRPRPSRCFSLVKMGHATLFCVVPRLRLCGAAAACHVVFGPHTPPQKTQS